MSDITDKPPEVCNVALPGATFVAVCHQGVAQGMCAVVYEGNLIYVGPITGIPVGNGCEVYVSLADFDMLVERQQNYAASAEARSKMN